MTKMEFQNAISGVTATYITNSKKNTEEPFYLSVAATKDRTVQVFENIPFRIVKKINQLYGDSFSKIDDAWIEKHPEWTFGSVFRDEVFFMSLDISYKNRNLFWGRNKEEALDVLIYCMNESLKETENRINELKEDSSYFKDISNFAQKLKGEQNE